jgi:H2-forming N5,N10-methylenetetrahydromethanopterin dehydrogenase-like enzyme
MGTVVMTMAKILEMPGIRLQCDLDSGGVLECSFTPCHLHEDLSDLETAKYIVVEVHNAKQLKDTALVASQVSRQRPPP